MPRTADTVPQPRPTPLLHVLATGTGRCHPCFIQHPHQEAGSPPPVLTFENEELRKAFFSPPNSHHTEDEDVDTDEEQADADAELALQNVDVVFARLAMERKAKWTAAVARDVGHAEQQLDRLEQDQLY